MTHAHQAAITAALWSLLIVSALLALVASERGDLPDWAERLTGWSLGPLFIAACTVTAFFWW